MPSSRPSNKPHDCSCSSTTRQWQLELFQNYGSLGQEVKCFQSRKSCPDAFDTTRWITTVVISVIVSLAGGKQPRQFLTFSWKLVQTLCLLGWLYVLDILFIIPRSVGAAKPVLSPQILLEVPMRSSSKFQPWLWKSKAGNSWTQPPFCWHTEATIMFPMFANDCPNCGLAGYLFGRFVTLAG